MSNTRRAFIDIVYRGTNVTQEISEDLISVTYTDNENGKADKVSLTLKDERSKWLNNWRPRKGDTIDLLMLTTNWRNEGDAQQLDCGRFKVDRVKHGGPPTRVTIEANSVDSTTSFRSRIKNRTWSEIRLKELAEQIAEANGLTVYFDSTENPFVTQSEQAGQSDANYLAKQAAKYGFGMKMHKDQIILFRLEDLDNRVGRFIIDKSQCTAWELESSASAFVEEVIVSYYDPVANTTREANFVGPLQPDTGNTSTLLPGLGGEEPEELVIPTPGTIPTLQDLIALEDQRQERQIANQEAVIEIVQKLAEVAADPVGAALVATGIIPKREKLNVPFFSIQEGELIAKSKFIDRNKSETIIKLSGLPLRLEGTVGVNVYITGFATYDGKYSIEKAKHTVGGSSKSDFELKRTVVT